MPQLIGDWTFVTWGPWDYYIATAPGLLYLGFDTDPDTVIIGSNVGPNFVHAGGGDDQLYGGASTDNLNGGKGDDLVYGNGGDDKITLSEGTDKLFGGTGQDVVQLSETAGEGWTVSLLHGFGIQVIGSFFDPNAIIHFSELSDFENVTGSNADDYIEGDRADNVLEDSWFSGSQDDDVLIAFAGDDIVRVHGGSDRVDAGSGDDRIEVYGRWMDNHSLTGGVGADEFDFTGLSHLQSGHFATVEDFTRAEGDRVLVDAGFVFDPTDGLDLTLLGQASVWATQSGSTVTLRFDDNGDRVMDSYAILEMQGGVVFDAQIDLGFV